jgi:magnesium and cobalt transporter
VGLLDDDNQKNQDSLIDGIKRMFSGRRRALTEKELQEAIESSEEEGILNEAEGDMLQSIFDFGDTIVREVMVPRTDMVSCPSDASLEELLKVILDSGHSRIPIYEGSVDHVVGVIYAKDLLGFWGASSESLNIVDVMRTPYFIPETKRIEDLLLNFRTKRVHIAIIVDEYGGTSGLSTIEDLLEEIVGDIQDEHDLEENWLQPQDDGSLLVDARANVEELEEFFDLDVPRDKFDTVGGYLFHLLGNVPRAGETVDSDDLRLTVVEADERKVLKVQIWRKAKPESDSEN